MKTTSTMLLLLLILNTSLGQGEDLVSLKQLQGIWSGEHYDNRVGHTPDNVHSYIIIKGNKALEISQDKHKRSDFSTLADPFSYIGFDNDKIPYPKKISDLSDKGERLIFYDVEGRDYDKQGNILPNAIDLSCHITYNEDIEDWAPGDTSNYLRFYGASPDDYYGYEQVTAIDDAFLLQLHKYNKVLWKQYLAFEGLKEKKVIVKKSSIYPGADTPKPTKMYLIEGDVFVVLEEKNDRIKIRYFGKKKVEGWIKKNEAN